MAVSVDIAFHDLINPQNTDKVEDSLPEFLAQIQLNDEDISKALALIGHKLQSPMELEALTACHILEYTKIFKKIQNGDILLKEI